MRFLTIIATIFVFVSFAFVKAEPHETKNIDTVEPQQDSGNQPEPDSANLSDLTGSKSKGDNSLGQGQLQDKENAGIGNAVEEEKLPPKVEGGWPEHGGGLPPSGKGNQWGRPPQQDEGPQGGGDHGKPDRPGGEDYGRPDRPGGGDHGRPDRPGGGDHERPDRPGGGDHGRPDRPGGGDQGGPPQPGGDNHGGGWHRPGERQCRNDDNCFKHEFRECQYKQSLWSECPNLCGTCRCMDTDPNCRRYLNKCSQRDVGFSCRRSCGLCVSNRNPDNQDWREPSDK